MTFIRHKVISVGVFMLVRNIFGSGYTSSSPDYSKNINNQQIKEHKLHQ